MPQITVSPYRTNVLDLIDKPLISPNGSEVIVRRSMSGFVLWIDGKEDMRTDDNLKMSLRMNMIGVSHKGS